MTFWKKKIDHPFLSSSSSTRSTTILLSDSEIRERKILSDMDSHEMMVSWCRWNGGTCCYASQSKILHKNKTKQRRNRETRFFPTSLSDCKKIQGNFEGWQSSWTQKVTCQFFMNYLWSPRLRGARIWKLTFFFFTTEIAKFVRDPKLQGSCAENVMTEPDFVQ